MLHIKYITSLVYLSIPNERNNSFISVRQYVISLQLSFLFFFSLFFSENQIGLDQFDEKNMRQTAFKSVVPTLFEDFFTKN